jgi:hypothetical protein
MWMDGRMDGQNNLLFVSADTRHLPLANTWVVQYTGFYYFEREAIFVGSWSIGWLSKAYKYVYYI